MDKWLGKVAFVTGASSGIGAAIAESLVKRGMKVVGCSRRVDKIKALSEKLKGERGSLDAVKCDLTKEGEILAAFDFIKKKYGGVDVCINSGGIGLNAPLLDGETAMWKQMLDVNVMALMICTRETVKSLKERNVDTGHIIHMVSLAGHVDPVRAESNMYQITKHAARVITEGHRKELIQTNSNIKVTAISPGYVETGFSVAMNGPEFVKKMYSSMKCLQASDIADTVEYVLSAPAHVQVHDIVVRPVGQTN